MPRKKTKPKRKRRKKQNQSFLQANLDNLVLLNGRQIFLYEPITHSTSSRVCKQLITLDSVSSQQPIILNINSGGGSVTDGFAIIDIMRTIKSPVVTFISGMAASMAGIIACTGYKRIMTANSFWMGHEMTCGDYDYLSKIKDRSKFYDQIWQRLVEYLKKYTKLSIKDLNSLQHGELWLGADKCKDKGIVDLVI